MADQQRCPVEDHSRIEQIVTVGEAGRQHSPESSKVGLTVLGQAANVECVDGQDLGH